MKITRKITSLAMVCLLGLSACSKDVQPGDYDASEVGQVKKVVPGVVVSMRPVRLHSKSAELNDTNSSDQNDSALNRSRGFEYVIKLNSGNIISVVQSENTKLKVKQPILVIYGANTRVVADNGSADL